MAQSTSLGLSRLIHDFQHRRERFRQFLGIVLVIVLALAGSPTRTGVLAGLVFFLFGSAVRLWASGHVRKDKVLATDGPYAFVRHPLYVGNILILTGFCLAAGVWWAWLAAALLLALFYPPAIRQEDAKLQRLFGEAWQSWSAEVRALVPRWAPHGRVSGSSWSFRQSLVQNGEPIIAAFLGLLMVLLWSRAA